MVASIKLTTKGDLSIQLKNLQRKINRGLPATTKRGGNRLLKIIGEEIRSFAKEPSGELEKSFSLSVMKTQGGVTARLQSDAPHARIHETGGVIRPRRRKFLTIPLTSRARRTPAIRFPGLFKVRGKKLLAIRSGRKLLPQFVLKSSVRIRPKRYLTKAIKRAVPMLSRLFKDKFNAIVR